MGELAGTRRRWSKIRLPERVAQMFGLGEDENEIIIEHFDEGLSSEEIPFISAFWEIKNAEAKRK